MTWANMIHFPDAPFVPEFVRGGSYAIVMGAYLGSEHEGRRLLEPIRDLGPGDGHVRDGAARRCSASWRWIRPSRCRSSSATS